MEPRWDENQPIYRQLRARIIDLLLDAELKDGDALPSVREVASDYRINPLTVLKAYQLLVDEGLVESRRGRGMFVVDGAHEQLVAQQRAQFVNEDWPRIVHAVARLGLQWEELLAAVESERKEKSR